MEALAILNGYPIALNPFSIAGLMCMIWLTAQIYRLRTDMMTRLASIETTQAVEHADISAMKDSVQHLMRGQQTIMSTMERHHDANIKTLFRRGGIRIMPADGEDDASA